MSSEPSALWSWKRLWCWNKLSESLQSNCSLILSCLCLPSPDAAPGLLPREWSISYWLGPCLVSSKRHKHTETEMYTQYLLTSPGSLHLSSSSSSRQIWLPILPTQSPWPVWEQRRSLETGILLRELEQPGRAGRLPGWNVQLEALGGRRPGVTVTLWLRHPGELSALKGLLCNMRWRGTENLLGVKF